MNYSKAIFFFFFNVAIWLVDRTFASIWLAGLIMSQSSHCDANLKCTWPSSRAVTNYASLLWQAEAYRPLKKNVFITEVERSIHDTSQYVSHVNCYSNSAEQVWLWAAHPCLGPSSPASDTLCSSDPPAVTASAPSAICHATPLHVYALLLSVSHDNLHLDPCDLTSVCLHPNYLDKLQDRPEPRALILSADLLTWPSAEHRRRSRPAGVVKT